MKVKGLCCGLLAGLIGLNALAAGEISAFVQKNLDLDLKSVPFGIQLKDHPEYTKVSDASTYPGKYTNWVFYVNNASASYRKDHQGRSLWFGFENGRLTAVEFRMAGMDFDGKHPEWHNQAVAVHKTFRTLPGAKLSTKQDAQFSASYVSFCNDNEDIFANIYISPLRTH